MYACGLRVSEAVSLTLDRFDDEERVLRVLGKGDKERIVPFYARVGKEVRAYIREVRPKWIRQEHGVLFVNQRGQPLTSRGVQYLMQRQCERCSLSIPGASAYVPPQLCYASAGQWGGYPRGAGAARTCNAVHYPDLHACQPGAAAQGV